MPRVPLTIACDNAWVLRIEIDGLLGEALATQVSRAARNSTIGDLQTALSNSIAQALYAAVDHDLQLPTPQQVDSVVAIARELNIALPGDALRFRGASEKFIARYIRKFRLSRKAGSPDARPSDE